MDARDVSAELLRVAADGPGVAPEDSIGVNDELDGWVSLGACERRADFYWYGRAREACERLEQLETGVGPAAVRAEFRSVREG